MQIYKSWCRFINLNEISMQIYTPPNKSRFIRCKTLMKKLIATPTKACTCWIVICLNTRLFATRLLSLSLHKAQACLSNQPNLPVTPQGQCRYGDKKGEYGRQLNHGQCFGSDCWGSYSTGTSTPQQSSSKPSQKNLEMMLCWFQHPLFSRSLPSKTGKQWTYWKVTYNFRNGW